jgi:hypothetical protein
MFNFINDHNAVITAISTVLLTVVTAGLVWIGSKQIDTTRAQLRAYVFARPIGVPSASDDTGWPTVELVMKNWGQTPAYDVAHWTCLNVDDYPDFKHGRPPGIRTIPKSAVLAPGGDAKIVARRTRPWTDEEKSAVASGAKQIYVWGEITYRDTFRRRQVTTFRLHWGGQTEGGGEMAWSKKDNEAT